MKIGLLISLIFIIVMQIQASSSKHMNKETPPIIVAKDIKSFEKKSDREVDLPVLEKSSHNKDHQHKHQHHKSHNDKKELIDSAKPSDRIDIPKNPYDEPLMYYPDDTNCNTYYACSKASGSCNVRRCPMNYIWMTKGNNQGYCAKNAKQVSECIDQSKRNQYKAKLFECPTIPDKNWVINGYFGDDNDCEAFYQCVDGRKFAYLCPREMHWNVYTGMCSLAEKSPCVSDTAGSGNFGSGDVSGSGDNGHLTKADSLKTSTKPRKEYKHSWGYTGRRTRRSLGGAIKLSIDLNPNGIIHEEMLIPMKSSKK